MNLSSGNEVHCGLMDGAPEAVTNRCTKTLKKRIKRAHEGCRQPLYTDNVVAIELQGVPLKTQQLRIHMNDNIEFFQPFPIVANRQLLFQMFYHSMGNCHNKHFQCPEILL